MHATAAVAEEGFPTRAIAEVLGRGLNVLVKSVSSEEAARHLEWLGAFADVDMSASSAWTQARLGCTRPGRG